VKLVTMRYSGNTVRDIERLATCSRLTSNRWRSRGAPTMTLPQDTRYRQPTLEQRSAKRLPAAN